MLDLSAVNATVLSSYDVVILGQMSLTASQVTMFTTWVNGGGNLIAMRPDKQLASLLGLTDAASTLSEAYLLVNTATPPGQGIVGQTMQFHGTADRYTLAAVTPAAVSVATLYSNATTVDPEPGGHPAHGGQRRGRRLRLRPRPLDRVHPPGQPGVGRRRARRASLPCDRTTCSTAPRRATCSPTG